MADTAELQKQLFAEMKGRIKEDDSSVPMKDGPFAYGSSFKIGGAAAALSSARRATAGRKTSSSTATRRPRARPISASAAVDHSSDHRQPPLVLRRQGLGILHAARARSRRPARTSPTSSPTPAARASGTPTTPASSTRASTPTIGPRRSSTTASAPMPPTDRAGLRGDAIPASSWMSIGPARPTGS